MKKRLISLLLVIATLLSILPVSALADTFGDELVDDVYEPHVYNPFDDVRTKDWFYESVMYAYVNRLFTGVSDTKFEPNGTMTRGMFVTVLGRLAGVHGELYLSQPEFTDVSAESYYAPYVAWAAKHGITTGTGDGLFSPDAMVNRQQMAAFFVRYFEAFNVYYEADTTAPSDLPEDFDTVADWAKDAVKQMWQDGILVGDGGKFDPEAPATRAQAATLCSRLDTMVDTWYVEPGVASDRERLDPVTGEEPEEPEKDMHRRITFYDGDREIDELVGKVGWPLDELPAVEKSSKEGHVLLGYYKDPEFTEPFYAGDIVYEHEHVYAKYEKMDVPETLMVRTFTLLDQTPDLSFRINRQIGAVSGEHDVEKLAVSLKMVDGSDPVKLASTDNGDGTYTIYAAEGFREGCSYELTLSDGWIFSGKEDTIRTASFTIFMEEVENLRMGDEIVYIEDTMAMDYVIDGASHPVLTAEVMKGMDEEDETGSFSYAGSEISDGDVLCIYTGIDPRERNNDIGAHAVMPAVYVKVKAVSGSKVTFTALGKAAQQDLYEIPDNFTLRVQTMPEDTSGTFAGAEDMISLLDEPMYMSVLGEEEGSREAALPRVSSGDYVTMYTDLSEDGSTELYFALITVNEDGTISYEKVDKQHILDSMDLYTNITVSGSDLVTDAAMRQMETDIQTQVDESDFAEQAASLLAEMVAGTEEFRKSMGVQNLLLTNVNGKPLTVRESRALAGAGGFTLNDVDLDVNLRNSGTHFNGGVQIAIDVYADFAVEAEDGVVAIKLSATFVEEVAIGPGVKGDLVYKEILGIPIPVGVAIDAHVDIRNYTEFGFDAEITTYDDMDKVVSETSVSSKLDGIMQTAEEEGLSENYYEALDELLAKYNELLEKETDWIKLVEQEIFSTEYFVYGLVIGVETDFVVRTDMSIAIGSHLSYEVGKRYSFWFKIGLFEPSAGSDTMDLIDEQFSFRFYVMGKLGVKAGIKAKLYAGIGSGDLASVGIAAEIGPYIKLWGLFIYDYTRTRRANTDQWITDSRMIGGLTLEFGLYIILSFEAEALGLFEYSHDFLDKEYPLLESGEPFFYYGLFYQPEDDMERVFLWDDDGDSRNGITMKLHDSLHALSYLNLKTGVKGAEVLDWDQFSVTLSRPEFVFDPASGVIYVDATEKTRYIECDMTITYKGKKMAFTNYDMTTTIPLIWTNLAVDELKEYYTVSVVVGDGDTHQTVWVDRVLKGQPFDLPTDAEIKDLIGWSDLRYSDASGYRIDQITDLTVMEDTEYYYDVTYRDYTINVGGIQQANGTIAAGTVPITAKYGEVFDFSSLKDTGYDVEGEKYTKFVGVSTEEEILVSVKDGDMTYAPMDLTKPITGRMAEALFAGDVQATADYVDDSVTAVFTFNGLLHEDVKVTTRKGTIPGLTAVTEVLDAEVRIDRKPVGICDLYPTLGPIDKATHYIVTCVGMSGERAMVSFFSDEPRSFYYKKAEPVEKLVGSLIVDIPTPDRRGYTFLGWFVEEGGTGENAFDQTVPEEGIMLHALWKPNTYVASFDLNGSTSNNIPGDMIVTYDQTYSTGNVRLPAMTADEEYTLGEPYGELPVPSYIDHRFLGWSTRTDRKDKSADDRLMIPEEGARHIEDDTITDVFDQDHTLYAQWTPLIDIYKTKIYTFKNCVTVTYDGTNQATQAVLGYTFNTDATYDYVTYDDTEVRHYTEDMFTIEFKKQGGPAMWRDEAVHAGVYDIRVIRKDTPELNGVFRAYEKIYTAALVIERRQPEKLTYSCDSLPIEETYWANVLPDYDAISLGSYESDGAVEFAATTSKEAPSTGSSKWTSGILYNVNGNQSTKTYHLWMRVGGGQDYLPSNSVYLGSGTISNSAGPVHYELIVKTANKDYAGTDMNVYATIGDQEQQELYNKVADSSREGHTSGCKKGGGDLHEEGCEDFHIVKVGSGLNDGKGVKDVTISVSGGGTNPGWRMDWFRIDAYEGSTRIAVGEKGDPSGDNEWFNAKECSDMSKTFEDLGVYGRNLEYSNALNVSNGETVTVTADFNMQDNGGSWDGSTLKRRGTYDVYQHRYAPQFYGKFSKPGFDDLISWSKNGDSWSCTFDKEDVRERMEEYDILELTFRCGYTDNALADRTISIKIY